MKRLIRDLLDTAEIDADEVPDNNTCIAFIKRQKADNTPDWFEKTRDIANADYAVRFDKEFWFYEVVELDHAEECVVVLFEAYAVPEPEVLQ